MSDSVRYHYFFDSDVVTIDSVIHDYMNLLMPSLLLRLTRRL